MKSPLDELAAQPDIAATLDTLPTVTETYSQADTRVARTQKLAAADNRAMARITGKDLQNRGIAFYTTPQGQPKELTDPTGAPLTNFDSRHKVAWDSTGSPQRIIADPTTGIPTAKPAYEGAPRKTDKAGRIYSAPAGLPWQATGETDPTIVAKNKTSLDRETNAALAGPEQEARARYVAAHKATRDSAKAAAKQFEALGIPTKDELGQSKFDLLNPDAVALQNHIQETTDREHATPEANAKPFLGGGTYSPGAQKLRDDIGKRKEQALALASRHVAIAGQLQQERGALDSIKAQRRALKGDQLAAVNEKRMNAGLAPVLPGSLPNIESATASSSGSPLYPNGAGHARLSQIGSEGGSSIDDTPQIPGLEPLSAAATSGDVGTPVASDGGQQPLAVSGAAPWTAPITGQTAQPRGGEEETHGAHNAATSAGSIPAPATPQLGILSEIGAGLVRGTGSALSSLGGLIRAIGPIGADVAGIGIIPGVKQAYETAGVAATKGGEAISGAMPASPGIGDFQPSSAHWWAARLPEVIPQLAAQLGIAALTGGAGTAAQVAAFAATGGGMMAGDVYNEAVADRVKKGQTIDEARDGALGEAAIVGTIGGALDAIPGGEFIGKNPVIKGLLAKTLRNKIVQRGVAGFLSEGITETGQEVVQDLAALGFRDDAARFDTAWQRWAAAGLLGGIAGAGVDIAIGHGETDPRVTELQAMTDDEFAAVLSDKTGRQAMTQAQRSQVANEIARRNDLNARNTTPADETAGAKQLPSEVPPMQIESAAGVAPSPDGGTEAAPVATQEIPDGDNSKLFRQAQEEADAELSGRKASGSEGVPDILSSDADFFGNLAKTESFQAHGLSDLDVPAQRVVKERVFRAAQNPQILNAIIRLLPVDVMDVLRLRQLTPEMALHDETVLSDIFSVDPQNPVPIGVDVAKALVQAAANATAKRNASKLDVAGADVENFSAVGARELHEQNPTPKPNVVSTQGGKTGPSAETQQGGGVQSDVPAETPVAAAEAELTELRQRIQRQPTSAMDAALLRAERGRIAEIEAVIEQATLRSENASPDKIPDAPAAPQAPGLDAPSPAEPATSNTESAATQPSRLLRKELQPQESTKAQSSSIASEADQAEGSSPNPATVPAETPAIPGLPDSAPATATPPETPQRAQPPAATGGRSADSGPSKRSKSQESSEQGSTEAGQSNLTAAAEKNISDAKAMQPGDPAGFLRKQADNARQQGKEDAAKNFEAAIAALEPPVGAVESSGGATPGEAPDTMKSEVPDAFANDAKSQKDWMQRQAKALGHKDVQAMVEKDAAGFRRLSQQWRAYHPRTSEGNFVTPPAIASIETALYGDQKPKTAKLFGVVRLALDDAEKNLRGSAGTSAQAQRGAVERWAEGKELLIETLPPQWRLENNPDDDGGQEHHVFFDEPSGRWVKITKGEGLTFGYTASETNGQLDVRRATPYEYLNRLKLTNSVIGDDIRLHAVYRDAEGGIHFVTSQPDVSGEPVDAAGIKSAMTGRGFVNLGGLKRSDFYRPTDNTYIGDLHEENAVVRDGVLLIFDANVQQLGTKEREALMQEPEFAPKEVVTDEDAIERAASETKNDLGRALKLPPGANAIRAVDSRGNVQTFSVKAGDFKGANPMLGEKWKKIVPVKLDHKGKALPEKLGKVTLIDAQKAPTGQNEKAPTGQTHESTTSANEQLPTKESAPQSKEGGEQVAEKPKKTRLELLLDGVERTGKELSIEVTDANRDNLTRIIDTAEARGLSASTDGRFVLVRKAISAPSQNPEPTSSKDTSATGAEPPTQPARNAPTSKSNESSTEKENQPTGDEAPSPKSEAGAALAGRSGMDEGRDDERPKPTPDRGRELIDGAKSTNKGGLDRFSEAGLGVTEGETGPAGIITNLDDGQIVFNAAKFASESQNVADRGLDPQAWADAAVSEELIHISDVLISGHRFGEIHEKIFKALSRGAREAVNAVYGIPHGGEQMSPKVTAAEYMRMLTQFRRGEAVTESTNGVNTKPLEAFLRGPQHSLVEAHYESMESVNAESTQESSASPSNPEPSSPSKPVSKREAAAKKLRERLGGEELAAAKTKEEPKVTSLINYGRSLMEMIGGMEPVAIVSTEEARGRLAQIPVTTPTDRYVHKRTHEDIDLIESGRLVRAGYSPEIKAIIVGERTSASDVAHEVGHHVERTAFAAADPETKKAIRTAYEKWLSARTKDNLSYPEVKRNWEAMTWFDWWTANGDVQAPISDRKFQYFSSFPEWFADNVAKWAHTSETPKSLLDTFFKKAAARLRKLWTKVKAHFSPEPTLAEWLDSLAPSARKERGDSLLAAATKPIADRETRLAAMEYADALMEDGITDPKEFAREVQTALGFKKPASYAALWNLAKLSGADLVEQSEAQWGEHLAANEKPKSAAQPVQEAKPGAEKPKGVQALIHTGVDLSKKEFTTEETNNLVQSMTAFGTGTTPEWWKPAPSEPAAERGAKPLVISKNRDATISDVTPEGYGPMETNEPPDPTRLWANPAEIQRLENSIKEGETILKGRMSPEKRGATERAVGDSKAKLAKIRNFEPETKPRSGEPKLERVRVADVEHTAQSSLATALDLKAKTWPRVKALRAKLKATPLGNSQIRFDLMNAESAHREALRMEEGALAAIEKRANELGQTTLGAAATKDYSAEAAKQSRRVNAMRAMPNDKARKLDTPAAPIAQEASIRKAYDELVKETGFPDVSIADVLERAHFLPGDDPMDRAKGILVSLRKEGRAIFSGADWSLSNDREKAWSIIANGEPALLVRLSKQTKSNEPTNRFGSPGSGEPPSEANEPAAEGEISKIPERLEATPKGEAGLPDVGRAKPDSRDAVRSALEAAIARNRHLFEHAKFSAEIYDGPDAGGTYTDPESLDSGFDLEEIVQDAAQVSARGQSVPNYINGTVFHEAVHANHIAAAGPANIIARTRNLTKMMTPEMSLLYAGYGGKTKEDLMAAEHIAQLVQFRMTGEVAEEHSGKYTPGQLRTIKAILGKRQPPVIEAEARMVQRYMEAAGKGESPLAAAATSPPGGATPANKLTSDEEDLIGPRISRGVGTWARRLYEGTADILGKTKGFEDVSKAIRKHVDRAREMIGEMATPYRTLDQKEGRKAFNAAEQQVETYYRIKDSAMGERPAGVSPTMTADQFEKTMTPEAKAHLATWRKTADHFGDLKDKLGVQVQTSEGKWRPSGRMEDYHPRMIRQDYLNAIRDPVGNPSAWRAVVKIMVDAKVAKNAAEVQAMFAKNFKDESTHDFFANVEKARELKLPTRLYDYSFEARRRYIASSAERLAQIEAYGQKTTPDTKDLFEEAQERTIDPLTQEYLGAVRDRAYSRRPKGAGWRALAALNSIATGTQLGNPVTVMANLLSGVGYNASTMGMKSALQSLGDLPHLGAAIKEARERGIILDDLMDMANDVDNYGSNFVSKVSNVTAAALKWTGYNASENFVRAMGYLQAKHFVRNALAANTRDRNSHEARSATAFFKRNDIDAEKVYAENGAGPETDRFYRAAVNAGQGGYRFDQVPVYQDTPIGRFLFKYQKWGAQATRNFIKNAVEPLLGVNGPVDVKPILTYALTTAAIGGSLIALKALLFGVPDRTPTAEEIAKTWDENQRRAIALAATKLFTAQLAAGATGLLGNYAQTLMDFTERSRFKSPLSPPGLSTITNIGEQMFRAIEQKELTAKDLDDYLSAQLSLYRTAKGAAGRAGLADREKARQDNAWLNVQTRRFASEVGVEAKRTTDGRIAKTPMSPEKRDLLDALRMGDTALSKEAFAKLLDEYPRDQRATAIKSIEASVRASQPIRIGTASEPRREIFLSWASRRLPAADMERVRRIDSTYRKTAQAIGIFSPSAPTPQRMAQTREKFGLAAR